MNHYECLKVTADAPAEVIRAAYRALAGKSHPDRQGGSLGRDDENHIQMVAINAAYNVLMNPELRAEYDAILTLRSKPVQKVRAALPEAPERDNGFSETRVDVDWMMPKVAGPAPLWPLSGHRRFAALALTLTLLAVVTWVVWVSVVRHQMDKALSDQFASHLPVPGRVLDEGELAATMREDEGPPPAAKSASRLAPAEAATSNEADAEPASVPPNQTPSSGATAASSFERQPTVTELSKLTDEQLVAILPSLGELQPAKGSFSRPMEARNHHPLDGKPLNLRSDKELIDPLDVPTQ